MNTTQGRAKLIYYGHATQELGNELPTPKKLTTNLKLDLATTAGTATVKQRMNAQLAWLMEEGMDLPVSIDPATGLATEVDAATLETELSGRSGEVDAKHDEQSSLRYSTGMPTEDEVAELKALPGKALGGLRKAWKKRK